MHVFELPSPRARRGERIVRSSQNPEVAAREDPADGGVRGQRGHDLRVGQAGHEHRDAEGRDEGADGDVVRGHDEAEDEVAGHDEEVVEPRGGREDGEEGGGEPLQWRQRGEGQGQLEEEDEEELQEDPADRRGLETFLVDLRNEIKVVENCAPRWVTGKLPRAGTTPGWTGFEAPWLS